MGEHATVSEIRRYPRRPEGFEEPLFHGRGSKTAVMEHFLGASWLSRASEVPDSRGGAGGGMVAKAVEEPVEILRVPSRGGREGVEISLLGCSPPPNGRARRGPCGVRGRARRGRVRRVLDRWREVGGWWEAPSERVDRLVFRLEIAGVRGAAGAVVDVALDKPSGRWLLVGVVD